MTSFTSKITAGAITAGIGVSMLFGAAGNAFGATDTPDYSISSTQSVFRPSAVQGTVTDSFKAVPGETGPQAVQGTARDSFKGAPVDHPLQCGKYAPADGSVMTCQ